MAIRKVFAGARRMENQLENDVNGPAGLMAVFQHWKIADHDLALMRRHLGREAAFAAAKEAVEGIEQELVRHSAPGHFQRAARAFIEGRPFLEDVLRGEIKIAPLIGRNGVLARAHLVNELRAVGVLLPGFFFVLVGPRRQGFNDAIDIRNRDALAGEIEQLDDVAHQLLVPALPERIVALAHFFPAYGNQRREKINDAFKISCASSWARPLVVQRIKAKAALGVKDDEILLPPAIFRIANPVLCFFRLRRAHQASHVRDFEQTVRELPAAAAAFPAPGAPVISVPSQSALKSR